MAFPPRIAAVAARAGIERGDEHEVGGEGGRGLRPADGHAAVLEGLPQHLERAAVEFGKFIEKEHAVMCQADLAGHRHGSTADKAGLADRVVRGAEGTGGHERLAAREQSQSAVDPRGLKRLGCRQRRQDRRDPLGEHRLAAAGRAQHQAVVPARGRHAQGPLRCLLAAHVGKIDVVTGESIEPFAHPRRGGGDCQLAGEKLHRLGERAHRDHLDILDDGGLGSARGRHHDALQWPQPLLPCGRDRDRKGTASRPRGAFERELTHHRIVVESLRRELAASGEDAQRDRQVERGRLLRKLGRRQIDHDAIVGPIEARIDHRAGDTVGALADGGVGEPDEHRRRQGARRHVDLHVHRHGVDPDQ